MRLRVVRFYCDRFSQGHIKDVIAVAPIDIKNAVAHEEAIAVAESMVHSGDDLPGDIRTGAESAHISLDGDRPFLRRKETYNIEGRIHFAGLLPKSAKVAHSQPGIVGGLVDWSIEGELASEHAAPARWRRPPHVVLANLPRVAVPENEYGLTPAPIDPAAAPEFTKRYGVLRVTAGSGQNAHFHLTSGSFLEVYELLRGAWTGENDAIEKLRRRTVEGIEIRLTSKGRAEVALNDLWGAPLCCFYETTLQAGRCANPDCPAPWFLKIRKTQKIWNELDCIAWAQRKYALKWWRQNRGANSHT